MSFYRDVIKKDKRFNSTQICKDISLLEPGTRAAVANLILLAHEAGHEIRIAETYRSQARQRVLYKQGYTQLKNVGCHGYGVACDLNLFINGKYDPNGTDYMFFEKICKESGLISGINWGTPDKHHNFRDFDHVQRVLIERQNEMFRGEWYPSPDYNPYEDMKNFPNVYKKGVDY